MMWTASCKYELWADCVSVIRPASDKVAAPSNLLKTLLINLICSFGNPLMKQWHTKVSPKIRCKCDQTSDFPCQLRLNITLQEQNNLDFITLTLSFFMTRGTTKLLKNALNYSHLI